jgi:hypothetical protein
MNFLKLLCEFPTDCEEIGIQFYLGKEMAVTTEEEELGSALSRICFAIAQVYQRSQIYAIEIRLPPTDTHGHNTQHPTKNEKKKKRAWSRVETLEDSSIRSADSAAWNPRGWEGGELIMCYRMFLVQAILPYAVPFMDLDKPNFPNGQ